MGALFLGIERLRGGLALAAWEREMQARGERLTVVELAPAPPTNRAVRILNPFEAQTFLALRAPADMPGMMCVVAPGKARAAWATESWLESRQTNTWAGLESELASLREQLPALRQGLTNRAYCVQLAYDQGFDLLLPHLGGCKGTVQALCAGTVDALHRGRPDEALDDLLAIVGVVDLVKDERLLISQLVGIACVALGSTAVWEALQAEGWTDGQLAALQERWERIEFVRAMSDALAMERAMAASHYRQLSSVAKLREIMQSMGPATSVRRGAYGGGAMEELVAPIVEAGAEFRRFMTMVVWWLAWTDQDRLFRNRTIQEFVEKAQAAAAAKHAPRMAETYPAEDDSVWPGFEAVAGRGLSRYDRARYWLSLMTMPALERALEKAAYAEARKELTVAAIALKRYALEHGHWPERLEELVPKFLTAVPRDWYSGGNLQYRRNGDGTFLLYSVGEDRRDDGGHAGSVEGAVSAGARAGAAKAKDMVWLQRATAAEVAAFEAAGLGLGKPAAARGR